MSTYDIAIFGEEHSNTDEASLRFPQRKEAKSVGYFRTIFEVFEAVESGQAPWGVVPYENSTYGSVFETLDGLWEFPLVSLLALETLEVQHHLVGVVGAKLSDVRVVLSHPQALAQCRVWLRENLPGVPLQTEASTAVAAQKVAEAKDSQMVAVASGAATEAFGLEILASDIQPKDNLTQFILIGKQPPLQDAQVTVVVFWFCADESGSLAQVLNFFAEKNINLSKLDSRRADAAHGGHLFFVDAEVSVEKFRMLAPELESLVAGVRILGGY